MFPFPFYHHIPGSPRAKLVFALVLWGMLAVIMLVAGACAKWQESGLFEVAEPPPWRRLDDVAAAPQPPPAAPAPLPAAEPQFPLVQRWPLTKEDAAPGPSPLDALDPGLIPPDARRPGELPGLVAALVAPPRPPWGAATCVAWGPDVSRVATGGRDGVIRLWDTSDWHVVAELPTPGPGVLALAFSPDGTTLVGGGEGGWLRLWGLAGGPAVVRSTLGRDAGAVRALAFSRDGSALAIAQGRWVQLGDPADDTLAPRLALHCREFEADHVSFSPDGRMLALGWGSHQRGHDLKADCRVLDLRRYHDTPWQAAERSLRATGREWLGFAVGVLLLASVLPLVRARIVPARRSDGGGWNRLLRAWSLASAALLALGLLLWSWNAHAVQLQLPKIGTQRHAALGFTPGGELLLARQESGRPEVALIDLSPRAPGFDGLLWGLIGAEQLLLFAAAILSLWCLLPVVWRGGQRGEGTRFGFGAACGAACVLGCLPILLWARGGTSAVLLAGFAGLTLLAAVGLRRGARDPLPGGRAHTAAGLVAAGVVACLVLRVWCEALLCPVPKATFGEGDEPVVALAASSDGRSAAAAGADGTVRAWDLGASPPAERGVVTRSAYPTGAVAISPDGRRVLAAGPHGLRLWDEAGDGFAERPLDPDAPPRLSAVSLAPDGRTLMAGCADGTLRCWDLGAGQPRPRWTVPAHDGAVLRLALAANGRRLASFGADRAVKVWELGDGAPRLAGRIEVSCGRERPVGLSLAPDGRALAVHDSTERQEGTPGVSTPFGFRPGLSLRIRLTESLWDLGATEPRLVGTSRQPDPLKPDRPPGRMAFAPRGKRWLAGGVGDFGLTCADLDRDVWGKHPRVVEKMTAAGALFSPDGRKLACWGQAWGEGGDKELLRTWDLVGDEWKTGLTLQPSGRVERAAFSPDGLKLIAWVVAQGNSHDVWLYDLAGPTADQPTVLSRGRWFDLLGFAPGGRPIVSTVEGGRIDVWDAAAGIRVWQWALPRPGFRPDTALAPDGRHLVLHDSYGSVFIARLSGVKVAR
jgi:WD40 repeat protein